MKRILFLLIIIIIIGYFQYNFINDTNNSYEILQYENPNKDIFENVVHEKLISVFTNITFDITKTNNKKYNYYDFKMDIMKKNDIKLNPIIKQNLGFYNIPLNIKNNIKITYETHGATVPLTIQPYFRYLIYQIEGIRRFYIFAPDNKNNLYFKKNKTTPIDYWNQNTKLYPLLNKTKYIEIILTEGQMLFIPMNWIYTSIVEDYSYTIFYSSDSIFSYFLK
jgi:hypothetical protein